MSSFLPVCVLDCVYCLFFFSSVLVEIPSICVDIPCDGGFNFVIVISDFCTFVM